MIRKKLEYLTELMLRSVLVTALPMLMLSCSGSLSLGLSLIRLIVVYVVSLMLVTMFNFVIDLTIRFYFDESEE